MRTMIVIDDTLHRKAREYAARQGITLAKLIEDALRQRLMRANEPGKKNRVRIRTFAGDGLQPGISLDRMESVYDEMEAR